MQTDRFSTRVGK